ncbi:MAG: sugar phosphate isomerase/epimerase [Lachnospiraceae bacterium]|nr:sugar phosphate isomerase/epimerase [Lachnospiraceae bacterium]
MNKAKKKETKMIYSGIPDLEHLEEWTALGVPFEYDDFMYPGILEQKEEVDRRVRAYLEAGRDTSRDTLHGPFLDITVHSSDRLIREASDYRLRQVCEIAMRMKVRGMIVHTNFIPNFYEPTYRQGWIDRNEEYFRRFMEDYPDIDIYMENMFDEEPDLLAALAERMQGTRFSVCLDIAHANISKTDVSVWQKLCDPYVSHYHINDNDGRIDAHLPLGSEEGTLDWRQVLPTLKPGVSVLIEVNSLEKYKKSREYLSLLENSSYE